MHAVVIYTACMIFAFENRSYLGEFETEFKKALARESGAQRVLLDQKTEGRKSRDTVPLTKPRKTTSQADCFKLEKIGAGLLRENKPDLYIQKN
jgi:hypothetical protein